MSVDAPPDKSPARIAGMFDAIAGRYDFLNTVLSGGLDRYWRRRAIATLALTGRETLLDVCTGTADLAIGAAPDGAEVWANPSGFARGVTIGAPPDPFSKDGQNWNLPPPNPEALIESGYAAFGELLAANMRHAGALRIDHVMGLTRLFWIPEGAAPVDGAYVRYPLEALLRVLATESVRARCLVVGEDLGTVPEGLRERLAAADVLSYRVLWFERQGSAFVAPERYPPKAAACVSTHDLPTIAGWWSGASRPRPWGGPWCPRCSTWPPGRPRHAPRSGSPPGRPPPARPRSR